VGTSGLVWFVAGGLTVGDGANLELQKMVREAMLVMSKGCGEDVEHSLFVQF
jgi:hypothetical protein